VEGETRATEVNFVPLRSESPRHGYNPELRDGVNLFAKRFGDLDDEAWLELLKRSVEEPVIEGVEFPGFPEEELQSLIHGGFGQQAMLEAWTFYRFCRDQTYGSAAGAAGLRLLDFGAGWGRISRPFMRDFGPADLFGYEPNLLFCSIARALNPNACFLHGPNMPDRSLPEAWFDVVVGYSVFSHLPRHPTGAWLAELNRCLRPGGWCVLTTWGRRFLERLEADEARMRRGEEIEWHPRIVIEAAGDVRARLSEYDAGEFVFLGDESKLYGDAAISEPALRGVLEEEGLDLELRHFDTASLTQDAFVLRRPGGPGR
jgi:SAM-dependent methyltransferase